MRAGVRWRNRLADIYEMGGAHDANRNLPLEGLRGLAVFLVFLVHYHSLFHAWVSEDSSTFAVSSFLWSIGHSGVDLFFVISGYLIYGAVIRKKKSYFGFVRRRIQRIYPTFLCVLAVYLVLSGIFPGESKIPTNMSAAALYILKNVLLLPGIFNIEPIITVSWSLSYEFFYYLFLPFLVALVGMRRWPKSARVVFFLSLAALLIAYRLVGSFAHPRLVMFISGILLYEALHAPRPETKMKPGFDYVILFLLVVTFPLIYVASGGPGQTLPSLNPGRVDGVFRILVLFVSFFFLTLGCFVSQGFLKALFSHAPLRWYGNMSYSYYLIHGLTLKGAALGLTWIMPPDGNSPAIFWAGLPIAFFITLLSSTLLFISVEKRFSLMPATPKAAKVSQASAEHGADVPACVQETYSRTAASDAL
jgi:exopolysaccharide production protein ExoZ